MRLIRGLPGQLALAVSLAVTLPPAAKGQERTISFDELFIWTQTLTLEDRPEALNARPSVRSDPARGWIVSDSRESQVRLYDDQGRLRLYFGRRGEGPGEFNGLSDAVRLEDGRIATLDQTGRVTLWSGAGERIDDFSLRLRGTTALASHGPDSLIAIAMPYLTREQLTNPVVHVISIPGKRIARSFLEPSIEPNEATAWVTVGGAQINADGDRLFVSMPLADTVWVFEPPYETPTQRIPIRSSYLASLHEIPNPSVDRQAFVEWAQSSHFVTGAAPVDSQTIIVSLSGVEKEARLLYVPVGSGAPAREIVPAITLIGMDLTSGTFLFQEPGVLEPNRLRIARVRPRSAR